MEKTPSHFDPRKVGQILAKVADANHYAATKNFRVALEWLEELVDAIGDDEESRGMAMQLLGGLRDFRVQQDQEKLEKSILPKKDGGTQ